MTTRRRLDAYDGTQRIGGIIVTGDDRDATYTARDSTGKTLGAFGSLKLASAAINSAWLEAHNVEGRAL